MDSRRKRALIAARPGGCRLLQQMLQDVLDLMPAHTTDDALELLEREPGRADLIVATFAFDDSQMIELLRAVKSDPGLRGIPFYCVRVRAGVLPHHVIEGMGAACKECGAADFIDVAGLPREPAARALRAMLGV